MPLPIVWRIHADIRSIRGSGNMKRAGLTSPNGRPPQRAKLAQDRSVATRKKILESAVAVWSARGFLEGYESSTVEEIASHAKTSRATVYYYFKKKEDILRELGSTTSNDIYEFAHRVIESGKGVDGMLDDVVRELALKLTSIDPAAIRLMVQLTMSDHEAIIRDRTTGVTAAFSLILDHAKKTGVLQTAISPLEFAEILVALCSSCCLRWAMGLETDLTANLLRVAAFALAGARSRTGQHIQTAAA